MLTPSLGRSAFLVAVVTWLGAGLTRVARAEEEFRPTERLLYLPGEDSRPLARVLYPSRPDERLPPPSYAHVHLDIYELSVGVADLRSAPVQTSIGTLTGRDIGVSGMQTLGVPFIAPHLGVGVEIPHALFYFHAGIVPLLGRVTGQVTDQGDASLVFAQTTAAYRWDFGRFILALGPSVGLRYALGSQAGGWNTNVLPTVGAELDLRARFLTGGSRPNPRGRGRHQGPPSSTVDLFVHVTTTGIDGASFMIAFGHSFGSLPGR